MGLFMLCLLITGVYATRPKLAADSVPRPAAGELPIRPVVHALGVAEAADRISLGRNAMPLHTPLAVRGILTAQPGLRTVILRDEQNSHRTLLCEVSPETIPGLMLSYRKGDRVLANGELVSVSGGTPTLGSCRLQHPSSR
jgi:hypothetical protein